jgi:hypothetical protein
VGAILALAGYTLGGISAVGPPLLLGRRMRLKVRLRPGELLWFCLGTATWLLWPPVIVVRLMDPKSRALTRVCFLYVASLMALAALLTLLLGGVLRRWTRWSWREKCGLWLCVAWACLGVYFLYGLYSDDLRTVLSR